MPLEDRIELDGKKVYQEDISVISAELATKLTYRDAVKEGKQFIKDFPSAWLHPKTRESSSFCANVLILQNVHEKCELFKTVGTDISVWENQRKEFLRVPPTR
ncbi:hypothetical protein CW713_02305 [Methanophagales archaeon]|nr:MAG: hypothetical protein CW713_02305 [Methanophagales archaeon]